MVPNFYYIVYNFENHHVLEFYLEKYAYDMYLKNGNIYNKSMAYIKS